MVQPKHHQEVLWSTVNCARVFQDGLLKLFFPLTLALTG